MMKSMELSDDEKLDAVMPVPMPEEPEYPFGLRICLTEAEMEKLNLDPAEAVVGGYVHLHAIACVTSVSSSDGAGGSTHRVELQIQMMSVESEDAENEAEEAAEDT